MALSAKRQAKKEKVGEPSLFPQKICWAAAPSAKAAALWGEYEKDMKVRRRKSFGWRFVCSYTPRNEKPLSGTGKAAGQLDLKLIAPFQTGRRRRFPRHPLVPLPSVFGRLRR